MALQIIGTGDVVTTRMLPALRNIGETDVTTFSFDPPRDDAIDNPPHVFVIATEEDASQRICRALNHRLPTIIATPPDATAYYLKELAATGYRLAAEKPFCADAASFANIRDCYFLTDKTFFLSYYVLEKAICWTWLQRGCPIFESFIDVVYRETGPFSKTQVPYSKLRRLSIEILEGPERSPSGEPAWYERNPIGLLLDMGVHTLSLVAQALPLQLFEITKIQYQTNPLRDTFLASRGLQAMPAVWRIEGHIEGCSVDVVFGKHVPANRCRRALRAEYDKHVVDCDFDDQSLLVRTWEGGTNLHLRRRRDAALANNYMTQMALMLNFFKKGWENERYDDWEGQCAALNFLFTTVLDSRILPALRC